MERDMHKIWLAFAALCLTGLAAAGVRADTVALAPDDHVLGKPDAPITIVEYASLTCPHCAEFDRDTLPKIKEKWIDTGKAKLVFRDFPLDGLALRAAAVARCAPADRYFGYIDILFHSQRNWATASDPIQALSRIARLGGMSDQQFQTCINNAELQKSIAASRQTAEKEYGVDSTPTFFVNGTKMAPGARPFEEFDQALTAAQPKS
jgi:protein-disulfide isomerase